MQFLLLATHPQILIFSANLHAINFPSIISGVEDFTWSKCHANCSIMSQGVMFAFFIILKSNLREILIPLGRLVSKAAPLCFRSIQEQT